MFLAVNTTLIFVPTTNIKWIFDPLCASFWATAPPIMAIDALIHHQNAYILSTMSGLMRPHSLFFASLTHGSHTSDHQPAPDLYISYYPNLTTPEPP